MREKDKSNINAQVAMFEQMCSDDRPAPEFTMPSCHKHFFKGHKWWCRHCSDAAESQFREVCEEYWKEERYLNRIDEKYEHALILGDGEAHTVGKVRITDATFKEQLLTGMDFAFGAALYGRKITGLVLYPIEDTILEASTPTLTPEEMTDLYKTAIESMRTYQEGE